MGWNHQIEDGMVDCTFVLFDVQNLWLMYNILLKYGSKATILTKLWIMIYQLIMDKIILVSWKPALLVNPVHISDCQKIFDV